MKKGRKLVAKSTFGNNRVYLYGKTLVVAHGYRNGKDYYATMSTYPCGLIPKGLPRPEELKR